MNMTPFNAYSEGYIVAEGDIDPAQIRASGSAYTPVLTLPLKLTFRAPARKGAVPTDLIFTLLTGTVYAMVPGSERVRLGPIDSIAINRFVSGD